MFMITPNMFYNIFFKSNSTLETTDNITDNTINDITDIEPHVKTIEQVRPNTEVILTNSTGIESTTNNFNYVLLLIVGLLLLYTYRVLTYKKTPKDIINIHFTREIKQHILRSRISAFYFLIINIISVSLQIGVVYLACPDLFRLIGFMEKSSETNYEGYSGTFDYILSSTAEFTQIIISYIPIVSHAVNLINALLNITLTLIGLYIFYKIFVSTILKSIYDMFINLKIIIMGNDEDYAKLRKIERYSFRMYLLYKSGLIQLQYQQNSSTSIDEKEDLVLNTLLNGYNSSKDQSVLLEEIDKLSDDIIKTSIQNNYALKDKDFVENHLEIKTCIETLFNETRRNVRTIADNAN